MVDAGIANCCTSDDIVTVTALSSFGVKIPFKVKLS